MVGVAVVAVADVVGVVGMVERFDAERELKGWVVVVAHEHQTQQVGGC